MSTSRFLIIAKHNLYAESIRQIITASFPGEVAVCTGSFENCWSRLGDKRPEFLFLHTDVIGRQGNQQVQRIRAEYAGVHLILFGPGVQAARLLELVRLGVRGYLYEGMVKADLDLAIREVGAGRLWLDQGMLCELADSAINVDRLIREKVGQRIDRLAAGLSRRERDVLELALDGSSTKKIAGSIHLSEQSVKLHLGAIFRKLGVGNRTAMAAQVLQAVCPVSDAMGLIREVFASHNAADHRRKTGEAGLIGSIQ